MVPHDGVKGIGVDQQIPKWISEARKMIRETRKMVSGSDVRGRRYWVGLSEQERRDLCFLSLLKSRHVKCAWEELSESEKNALWNGILKIRELQQQTSFFTQEDFNGVVDCQVGRRVDEPKIPNSMH